MSLNNTREFPAKSISENNTNNEKDKFGEVVIEDKYQPNVTEIKCQIITNKKNNDVRKLNFQKQWYNEFTWLHYKPNLGSVFCYICYTADLKGLNRCSKEKAFYSNGFNNWKKAKEKFSEHQKSTVHINNAESVINISTKFTIDKHLSTQYKSDQLNARHVLKSSILALQYISGQGIALRGHEKDDGNYLKLLCLLSKIDNSLVSSFNENKHNYTSPLIQNEILGIMADKIIKKICHKINNESIQFGIIVDG